MGGGGELEAVLLPPPAPTSSHSLLQPEMGKGELLVFQYSIVHPNNDQRSNIIIGLPIWEYTIVQLYSYQRIFVLTCNSL